MTNDGKLNGIDLTFYVDCGSSPNEIDVAGAQIWADNGTFCIAFWCNHSALEHRDSFHLSTIMPFFRCPGQQHVICSCIDIDTTLD